MVDFLFSAVCPSCSYQFKTIKTHDIQCGQCKKRFDLTNNHSGVLTPICPNCGGVIIAIIGSKKIQCSICLKLWEL